MSERDYKKYYQKFLSFHQGSQVYTAHSHHFWPDVTLEAQMQYWQDAARYIDKKWEYIFSEVVPSTQKKIAKVLNLNHPEQIVFASNTHELVFRLLSCLDANKKINILTTDSEFYSFERQIQRYKENQNVHVEVVPTEPFVSFHQRMSEKLKSQKYDLFFLSQVFFNSSYVVSDLKSLTKLIDTQETLFVIDGYHGFMAVPTDLSEIQDRVFYIAGSYKYAQGGEGCCFMVVPQNDQHRPLYTGWFADFANLSQYQKQIQYSNDGYRFAGSTMDFTALYRLNAVLTLFENEKITVNEIDTHVKHVQKEFITQLNKVNLNQLGCKALFDDNDLSQWGHFLTLHFDAVEKLQQTHETLLQNKIKTDFRGQRLRFGFGLYHSASDVDLSCLW